MDNNSLVNTIETIASGHSYDLCNLAAFKLPSCIGAKLKKIEQNKMNFKLQELKYYLMGVQVSYPQQNRVSVRNLNLDFSIFL